MKKRIVPMLLLAALLCGLLAQTVPAARALPGGDPAPVVYQESGTCGSDLTWEYFTDGELRISGSGAMSDYSKLGPAPWTHLAEMITKITLPEGLTHIGNSAFSGCINVASVTVPEGVTSIGEAAFIGCEGLKSITLPSSLTALGEGCFVKSGLVSVVVPENVTELERYTFTTCDSLKFAVVRNPKCRLMYQIESTNETGDTETIAQPCFPEGCIIMVDHDESLDGLAPTVEDAAPGIREYYCYIERYAAELNYPYEPLHPFSDVTEGKYYELPVAVLSAFDVAGGTGGGRFSPSKTCNREQVVTFLHAAFGKPKPKSTDCPFTDVKPGKYYYEAVVWAYENGITSGVSTTKFGVGKPCTRAQIMTFIWKCMRCPEATITSVPFTDVNPEKYYYPAVLWAYENGITGGVSATKFGTSKSCTRAQMATFLYATTIWLWSTKKTISAS